MAKGKAKAKPKSKSKPKAAKKADPADIGAAMAEESLSRRAAALARRSSALGVTHVKTADAAMVAAAASAGLLVAEGDSWFDYPWGDILNALDDDHGYDIESVANRGDNIEDMAYSGGQLDEFTRLLEKVLKAGKMPKAILLSGGGNDVIGDQFAVVLNHARSSLADFNAKIVEGLLNERIDDAYRVIIAAITKVCELKLGRKIPIIVHGYDYCVPDGRSFWWIKGPWLEPAFERKGYDDMTIRKQMVRRLIDDFNSLLAKLASDIPHVRYLNLRDTLSTDDADYMDDWDNETHPTQKGFKAVTEKFATLLATL
jgi:lysophospholipase L1-like esterase